MPFDSSHPRVAPATGLIGVLSGVAVLVLVAASSSSMTMTALLSVLVAQLAWNLAAGLFLFRHGGRVADAAGGARPASATDQGPR